VTLSAATLQGVFAQETDEAWLVLLTIDHADLGSPIRVGSDAVDTVSRGNTFIAFPFRLALPTDEHGQLPRARLQIDNVDRQIVDTIRSIGSAPSVLMEIVRAAAPDTVEASWPDFVLDNATYDALTVSGALTLGLLAREPYPADNFTPSTAPGVF
jgi:cellulase/cellobiase CelA1